MSWDVGGDKCGECVFQIVGAEPFQAVKVEFCPMHKAAPELLEAVKDCKAQIEGFDPGGCKGPYDRVAKARAALAKAEGKT